MKNLIMIILVACGLSSLTGNVFAQGGQAMFPVRAKDVVTGGLINSSTRTGGSATASSVTTRSFTTFPLYSKRDTVTNTGADTIYQGLSGQYANVYTWCSVTSISGTNTSCTVRLQATPDNVTGAGRTGDWVTIKTYTVSATGNPYEGDITKEASGGNGWNYTNFRWIFTGVGTHSSSWQVGMSVK